MLWLKPWRFTCGSHLQPDVKPESRNDSCWRVIPRGESTVSLLATCIHTYIHRYIDTYIHTYIQTAKSSEPAKLGVRL